MEYNSIIETIGNTPIVRLKSFSEFKGTYFAKLESFNPGGSSKDRIGVTIIDEAEKNGLLHPGGTIVEATSGNTGLGLALVAIVRGYKMILVMPDKMSPEKMNLVKAVGCKVVVCPTEVEPDDPRSYYSVSKRLAEETPNSFFANQYYNDANPKAHYTSTGPEIWRQTSGKVTHFIAGVGTGGTISGTARYLKEQNPDIKIIGIDPYGSILAHYHKYRSTDGIVAKGYQVEGVGEDIIPSNVHFDLIDDFVTVTDQESFEWTRRITRNEGMLVGPSSGLAIAGAIKYAHEITDPKACVVILLPDTGERYLGKVFSDAWMRSNGFMPEAVSIDEILEAKSANLPAIISLSEENTIKDAYSKIQKFSIEILLVESTDNTFQYLTAYDIYDEMLNGSHPDKKLIDMSLKKILAINKASTLFTIQKKIITHNYILILDEKGPIGIITKEDIVKNLKLF